MDDTRRTMARRWQPRCASRDARIGVADHFERGSRQWRTTLMWREWVDQQLTFAQSSTSQHARCERYLRYIGSRAWRNNPARRGAEGLREALPHLQCQRTRDRICTCTT